MATILVVEDDDETREAVVGSLLDLGYEVHGCSEAAGAKVSSEFGIPHGPIREIEAEGGHGLAISELTRPEVPERFRGRRDW